MRRGTFREDTVDYAAVGATQAADLMGYPPERSRPAEERLRIGSGEARFVAAGETLLAWGAQKGAGLQITDPRPAAGPTYTGVSFDDEGNAIAPSKRDVEQRFDADGMPFASSGMTVKVAGRVGGLRADGELRVIYVVEEARRVGFALGTMGGSVVSGEESFMVEWQPNDEVWITVRAFDAPSAMLYRLFGGLVKRRRRELFTRYLRALSPMYATPS